MDPQLELLYRGFENVGARDFYLLANFDFISPKELLVTACDKNGGQQLTAMGADGRHLWEDWIGPQSIWPLLVMGPDGSRLARETLAVNRPVSTFSPIDAEDIKGQLVRVFDAANGKIALEAPASPPLDAGGNVAISPSGRRVAVVNGGAIEVFDLRHPRLFRLPHLRSHRIKAAAVATSVGPCKLSDGSY